MASLVELCAGRAVERMRQDGCFRKKLWGLPLELLRFVLDRSLPLDLYYLELDRECTDHDPVIDRELQLRWKSLMESHHSKMRNYKELDPGGQFDWKQLYWEAHVQNCLDNPVFPGGRVDVPLPELISERFGSSDLIWTLQNTLSTFGHFAKALRITSLLCVDTLSYLLQSAELRSLAFYHLKGSGQFQSALQMILSKAKSLKVLELWYCRMPQAEVTVFFQHIQCLPALDHFAVMSSLIPPMSQELGQFLQRSRSLRTLQLSNNTMSFVSSIDFDIISEILSQRSTSLSRIEVDELPFYKCPVPDPAYLPSLKRLDLRFCSLDGTRIRDLLQYLGRLRALETLGLADNFLGNAGIRLVSSFVERSLSLRSLVVTGCGFCRQGAAFLLDKAVRLKELSISYNNLGDVSSILAEYLARSAAEVLDIEGIGLNQLACNSRALLSALIRNRNLLYLNISKNRIGLTGARLLHDVICKGGGNLTSIDASYNILSEEALRLLANAVQANAKSSRPGAKLRRLDLRGNPGARTEVGALFEPFSSGPEPVVLLSGLEQMLHDDDP